MPYKPQYHPTSWKIVFKGIPGIIPSDTVGHKIELKIPRSRKPRQEGFSVTLDKTTITQDCVGHTYVCPVTGHPLTITPDMVGKLLIDVLGNADSQLNT